VKAIKERGQPKSKITHLIFCTTSGVDMLEADYQLTKLLSLQPCVKMYMMYLQGCFAGGTVLRLAKDLAENSKGVVCWLSVLKSLQSHFIDIVILTWTILLDKYYLDMELLRSLLVLT